jgi:predicted Zn finger-like uncharacterized protein
MHIRCESCKAEYEVDETLMQGGRLEVQCSVCAQVFFVSRPDGSKSPLPAPEESPWVVQTSRGATLQFANLADLQQNILEGKLATQDKLTRDRRTWQTLGSMAEFAPFFGTARAGGGRERRGSEPQEAAVANETSRFVLEPKSHGLLKMSIGLAVATGVAFAGIRWQQDRNLRFHSHQALAAVPAPSRAAPPLPAADTTSTDQAGPAPMPSAGAPSRGAVVERLPSEGPAPSAKTPVPVPSAAPPAHASESYDKLVAEADRSLEHGADARARELYQRALNLRPAGFKAMTGLGFVALDRGQLPVAYDYFKRALTAKTSYPPALFGIAEVHRARGEKSLALHTYQRYLDMSPDGADAPAARRQVQNLQSGR